MFVLLRIPLFFLRLLTMNRFQMGAIHEWRLQIFERFPFLKYWFLYVPFWFVRLGSSMPFPWTGSTRRWQRRQKETGYDYWRHLRMCFWLSDVWGLRPQKWLTPGLREPLSRLNTNPVIKNVRAKNPYIVWFSGVFWTLASSPLNLEILMGFPDSWVWEDFNLETEFWFWDRIFQII